MERYEKATLVILTNPKTYITAKYNPTEYTLAQEAVYESAESGQPSFKEEQIKPFSVTLFFDSFEEKKDVRNLYTQQIAALTHPSEAGKERKQPPECIFTWANLSYKGRVQKVEQKFTLFLQNGTPVRATVTITMISTVTPKEFEEMQGKEACRKLWTVRINDRLDRIAYQALYDVTQWRKIAAANEISNPLTFPTPQDIGRVIVIPD